MWCRAGQIISRTVKSADKLTAFQLSFQRASHPRAMPSVWEEKVLYLEASKIQITDTLLDGTPGTKTSTGELLLLLLLFRES